MTRIPAASAFASREIAEAEIADPRRAETLHAALD